MPTADDSKDTNGNSSSWRLLKIIFYFGVPVYLAVAWTRSPVEPIRVELPSLVKFPAEKFNIFEINESHKLTVGTGPESIEFDDAGNLYTGLLNGKILKIHPSEDGEIGKGEVEVILDGLKEVENRRTDEFQDGRALGMRICQKKNLLYVIDAYYGLYTINLENYEVKFLVHADSVNPTMKFVNDLTLSQDSNTIYFTDSSWKFPLHTLPLESIEGTCTGRVFKYEVKTDKLKIFAKDLCLPNGIQLTLNESGLIISESLRYRILFYDINSRKKIKEIILPGNSDNIRPSSQKGHYWVACPILRTKVSDFILNRIWLRKLGAGILPTKILYKFAKRNIGMAFKINENGDIISTIFDKTGDHAQAISQVTERIDGELWYGSFYTNFIGKTLHET